MSCQLHFAEQQGLALEESSGYPKCQIRLIHTSHAPLNHCCVQTILEFESQNEGSGDKHILKWNFGNVVQPHHLTELETWHHMLISSQGLQSSQCLLMAHHKPGSGADNLRPNQWSNVEEDPEDVRQGFRRYLVNIVQTLSEDREREQMSIIS
uniref:Intraflagellar transport 22 homolog (Chlamydomonas) n=1 Tax=Salmo trutta TaxID=8032 RepID=A0A673X6Y0_SALTR